VLRFHEASAVQRSGDGKDSEDTAFYRYNRFVALTSGGDPDASASLARPSTKPTASRQEFAARHACDSTHDTKRGEDTRARLAVLSDMPEEWARQCRSGADCLRARRGDIEDSAPPDRNDDICSTSSCRILAGRAARKPRRVGSRRLCQPHQSRACEIDAGGQGAFFLAAPNAITRCNAILCEGRARR